MFRNRPVIFLLFVSQLAYAQQPDAPDIELFISGSSAQDRSLENLMRLRANSASSPTICEEGSLRIYQGEIDGVRKQTYACRTSDRIDDVPAGIELVVHKSSGGSDEGIAPVAESTPLRFIDLENLPQSPACRNPVRVLHTPDLAAYTSYRQCGGAGQEAIPQAGISDMSPSLLGKDPNGLTVSSSSQIVWGLPVSKNLRNALQAVQGLVPADVPHDSPVRETESVMPSLPRDILANIFAGTFDTWGDVPDRAGAPIYLSSLLPDQPPARPDVAGVSPGAYRPDPQSGSKIYVCRRAEGSGTQAAYERFYLGQSCIAADASEARFVRPDAVDGQPGPATGARVVAGRGTSDVVACLDAHDDNNQWAIGLFSTENIGNNASREFRHIQVDGYSPSLINSYRGQWRHTTQPSVQWRDDDREFKQALEGRALSFITSNLGRPEVLRSLNSEFRHSWGQGGYLALNGDRGRLAGEVTEASLSRYPMAREVQDSECVGVAEATPTR